MVENNPQVSKGSAEKVAVADPAQAKDAKKDGKGADSMLDVFTSEELVESPVSRLSKDLADISVYSLLEQTKQLAEEIKLGH